MQHGVMYHTLYYRSKNRESFFYVSSIPFGVSFDVSFFLLQLIFCIKIMDSLLELFASLLVVWLKTLIDYSQSKIWVSTLLCLVVGWLTVSSLSLAIFTEESHNQSLCPIKQTCFYSQSGRKKKRWSRIIASWKTLR